MIDIIKDKYFVEIAEMYWIKSKDASHVQGSVLLWAFRLCRINEADIRFKSYGLAQPRETPCTMEWNTVYQWACLPCDD